MSGVVEQVDRRGDLRERRPQAHESPEDDEAFEAEYSPAKCGPLPHVPIRVAPSYHASPHDLNKTPSGTRNDSSTRSTNVTMLHTSVRCRGASGLVGAVRYGCRLVASVASFIAARLNPRTAASLPSG